MRRDRAVAHREVVEREADGAGSMQHTIGAIAVDAWGSLWVCGGYGGIAVYRNRHWTQIDEEEPRARQRRWRCAYADTLGGVYFGSADGLVVSVRDNVFGDIQLPVELPSAGVQAVTADSAGVIFALNGAYLLRLAESESTVVLENTNPDLVSLTVSPSGDVWVANRWGIYRREGGQYVELPVRPSERNVVYSAIGFDASGALWSGTEAGNIHRYDGEVWMRMADADEQSAGAAGEFQAYRYAGVLVTGSGGGVSQFDGARWSRFDPAVFGGRPARRVVVSPNGIPVAATDVGIWGYGDTGEWQPVTFVGEDGDGGLLDDGIWDPASPRISTIEFDAAGRLYVGTERGLAIIDDSGARWLDAEDGLGGNAVTTLLVAPDEELWVGFRTDGLTRVSAALKR